MWRSTLKSKAREHVIQNYPLGSNQLAEVNLANTQELIQGAMFVRGSTEEDVCFPTIWPSLD